MSTTDQPDPQQLDEEPDAEQPEPQAKGDERDQAGLRQPPGWRPIPESKLRELRRAVQLFQQLGDQFHRYSEQVDAALRPLRQMSAWSKTVSFPAIDYTRQFDFSGLDAWASPLVFKLDEVFSQLKSLEHLKQSTVDLLHEKGPDNWTGLHDTHDLWELLHLPSVGIPVTWVPRSSVLAELLDAEEEACLDVLLAHQAGILSDCSAAIAPARLGPFAEQVVFTEQAIAALRQGGSAAAQALAACVMDTLLRKVFEPPPEKYRGYYGNLKKRIDSETSLVMLPWALTHWPVVAVLNDFRPNDPTPPEFNRHATAHRVDSIQYTPGNALLAVMLTTSVLREAHHSETATPGDRVNDDGWGGRFVG